MAAGVEVDEKYVCMKGGQPVKDISGSLMQARRAAYGAAYGGYRHGGMSACWHQHQLKENGGISM